MVPSDLIQPVPCRKIFQMYKSLKHVLPAIIAVFIWSGCVHAQIPNSPLTSKEIVSLVYQLPQHPEKRDEIVEEIRNRGIGFPLTSGLRSLVATKSGNDALLRRTLEEAERRRTNPTASALPSETEANELLGRTSVATLAAAAAMPDFIVKQLIRRTVAYGNTNNWIPQDNLSIAVSYRANIGEEYKILTVNGLPQGPEMKETRDYSKYVGGASSSGVEYISSLASLFMPASKTTFRPVDTDLLQTRRTIVYEYEVKKSDSRLTLTADKTSFANVGSRGRIWIDRETNRVLRFEQIATEIPPDFPITAASTLIDYDWVTIGENEFVLPIRSEVLITAINKRQVVQSRNEIRFRGYQKYGAELKVIDEIDEKDFPPEP
ncbi:hypothetical protein BH18ACI4_BH18ACI4_28150 [soil metagenome]